jgi:hypothetical protein
VPPGNFNSVLLQQTLLLKAHHPGMRGPRQEWSKVEKKVITAGHLIMTCAGVHRLENPFPFGSMDTTAGRAVEVLRNSQIQIWRGG